jgi:AraC-like DNA-binding protein
MQIHASFWQVFRRLCAQHLAHEPRLWIPIRQHIETVVATPQRHRDRPIVALFEALAEVPDALELGIRIGAQIPLTACGIHSLALFAAPTASDALKWIADAHQPGFSPIECRYETDARHGGLTIDFRWPLSEAAQRLMVAIGAVFLDRLLRHLSGRSAAIASVQLAGHLAGSAALYRRHLPVTAEPDSATSAVIVERALLDASNPAADPDTFDRVRQACGLPLAVEPCGDALRHRVRDAILSNIAAPPSQQQLARMLGLTSRQFRQCLQRERTSYQAVVRQCRAEYASDLLLTTSLSQIAERLGYSDQSAFSHAFCRWTGRSPSEFRDELRSRQIAA